MAANVNIVVNAQDRASGVLRKISHAFREILQVTLGIRLAQTLNRMGEAVRAFGINSIDATAELQMFQIGIETLIAREQLMKNTTMEVGDAFAFASAMSGDYISRLQDIALISPFQFTDVQRVVRQAMAFGFGAEEALSYARATLNVAAGVGASNDMLRRMAYNLAQIRLQGKVTKLDIRQLALAGFDLEAVLRHVGDRMEVEIDNYEDFNRALKTGLITWEDFTTGYADYADTYFGGASERMTRTFFGLKNTFKDVFAVTMPQILGPTLDAITDYTSHLLDLLIELRESGQLEAWGAEIKVAFDEKIKPVFDFLLYGITDRDNPVVRLLNMFRHLKAEGFFGKTWEYIFEQMTGIDLTPLQDALRLALDIVASLRDEGLLATGTLTLLDQLLGLDSGTLAGIRDKIIWIIDEIKIIIESGLLSGRAALSIGSLLGIDPGKIRDIQKTIKAIIDWFVVQWETLMGVLIPIWEGFKEKALPIFGMLGLVLGYLAITVGGFLIDVFKKLGDWFRENGDLIGAFITNIMVIVGTIGTIIAATILPLWTLVRPIILGIIGFVLRLAEVVMKIFTGDFKGAWESLMVAFQELIAGVVLGIAAWLELVGPIIKGLWENHMKPWLIRMWENLQIWWQEKKTNFTALVDGWVTSIKEGWALHVDAFKQMATDLGDKFVEGWEEFITLFSTETLITAWEEIKLGFVQWLTDIALLGGDLIVALATGFLDGLGAALLIIGDALTGVVTFVNDKLKVESPSRVFMEIGAMSMAGFLQGFGDMGLIKAGFNLGSIPAMAGAGAGGQQIVINNHYHGLTLNDRLQATRDLRPIVESITR